MLVYCFQPVRHSIVPSFCQSVIPSMFNVFFCNIRNVCPILFKFYNTTTIRQCVFGGKIRAEGSVSQELCHFVIPPIVTDKNRISTGDVTHEFRTNRIVTDSDRTLNGHLSLFCPVECFEHVQNFPPDRTDINGHHRTRNRFTRLETDIKRIRTDMNGLKEFLSVTHPLARCDRNFNNRLINTNYFY